jgi:Zn-dependent M28 family amino/carboxypeptidase
MKFDVRAERLEAHLRQIVGDRNPFTQRRALEATAAYIEGAFRGFGLATQRDSFEMFSQLHHNLVACVPSLRPGLPPLVVGAHYDGVEGSPAADDNATGVAALLELGRLFAAVAPLPAPLVLVGFALEECDLAGSRHLCGRMRESAVPLRGMISLEMLGYKSDAPNSQRLPPVLAGLYPRVGNFIGVVGNSPSRELLELFACGMKTTSELPVETFVAPDNGELIPETRLSDHAPFWDAGYRALMVTDTSFFRNPHYHQPTDTLETIDLPFLTKVTKAVARGMEAVLKSTY